MRRPRIRPNVTVRVPPGRSSGVPKHLARTRGCTFYEHTGPQPRLARCSADSWHPNRLSEPAASRLLLTGPFFLSATHQPPARSPPPATPDVHSTQRPPPPTVARCPRHAYCLTPIYHPTNPRALPGIPSRPNLPMRIIFLYCHGVCQLYTRAGHLETCHTLDIDQRLIRLISWGCLTNIFARWASKVTGQF